MRKNPRNVFMNEARVGFSPGLTRILAPEDSPVFRSNYNMPAIQRINLNGVNSQFFRREPLPGPSFVITDKKPLSCPAIDTPVICRIDGNQVGAYVKTVRQES